MVANGAASSSIGAVTYEFQVDDSGASFPSPSTFNTLRSNGSTSSAQVQGSLLKNTTFFWRTRATAGAFTSNWSPTQTFATPDIVENRTPDPAPGQKLPLPNEAALIQQVASQNSGALANSCIEEGGSWEFMDAAVEALREKDTRWGYNCKRGDCNHISIDVVDYFWGIGDGGNSTDVYIIDIINAVCPGGNQSTSWTDQTEVTHEEGAIGRWVYPRP